MSSHPTKHNSTLMLYKPKQIGLSCCNPASKRKRLLIPSPSIKKKFMSRGSPTNSPHQWHMLLTLLRGSRVATFQWNTLVPHVITLKNAMAIMCTLSSCLTSRFIRKLMSLLTRKCMSQSNRKFTSPFSRKFTSTFNKERHRPLKVDLNQRRASGRKWQSHPKMSRQ